MKIKRLLCGMVVPRKATDGAAAYDVFLPCDYVVNPGRQVLPLGFALEIPYGFEAKIEPRSGFSSKGMEDSSGVRRDADVIQGKIDSDYRGPVGVIVRSCEPESFMLPKGTRVAQLTFYAVGETGFEEVEELSPTSRGPRGFGSTGVI